MNTRDLAKKFLAEEKLTLRNALAYAALGLSEASGAISGIVTDIAFNGHAYNDERKGQMADLLGKVYFCSHILIGSTGYTPEEIDQRYVKFWLNKEKKMEEILEEIETRASARELGKHIKPEIKPEKLKYAHTDDRQNNKIHTEPVQLHTPN